MEEPVLADTAVQSGGAFGRAAWERAFADVEADIGVLAERLAGGRGMGPGGRRDRVGAAMAAFLADFFDLTRAKGSRPGMAGMVALPMLVHGAETGDAGPARPVAVVHLLWWAAARHLDDLTDAPPGPPPPGGDAAAAGARLLTALVVGGQLPVRLLDALPVPAHVRAGLADEVARCWLDAVDGQLRDLTDTAAEATPESVLHAYAGKTGSPYAMAAAAAARLAGADAARVTGWRDYGRAVGVLRQLVNDQRDLGSGRHEDLANGTATHLLAHLLASLPAGRRREALALHAAARGSADARAELAAWLGDAEVRAGYGAAVAPLVGRAHGMVDALGGDRRFLPGLHGLVDEAAGFLPAARPAVA